MNRSSSKAARTALAIDVIVDSARWRTVGDADAVLRRAVAEAADAVATAEGEVAIVLTDDDAIRALNRDWRGKDEPTNVLSFPAAVPGAYNAGPRPLGDIVIAHETVAREALAEGKPLAHHLAHLVVHGFLHLVGYDHEASEEADAMEALEVAILARLAIADPYRLRDVEPAR
jgi:probable rRNA maturation factor